VKKGIYSSVFALALVLGTVSPAVAQAPPDTWQVTIAPYLMGAAMNGTVTLRGTAAQVDLSASDVFSNLEFGAMGVVAARKGNWGFGGDAIWMALGASSDTPPGTVDFNQGAFAFYGLRRMGPYAELTFGARVNVLQGKIKLDALQTGLDQNKTWVDPLVGIVLRMPEKHRVGVKVYTEIGGFGAGSDFEWQVFPTVSIMFTKHVLMDIGYRWLDMDYSKGDGNQQFGYDVLTQGPVLGFSFKF
jgi:hypothetical protein